jgi:hypothetical protein
VDDPVLRTVEAALGAHFGQRPARASVSFVGVEPIEILRFETGPDEVVYVSLGVSRRPMTRADDWRTDPGAPRAEVELRVRPGAGVDEVWRSLAVLSASPAVEGVVLAPGMSVDLGSPLAAGSACQGVLVETSAHPPIEVDPPIAGAAPVMILSAVPATRDELAWSRVHGAAALRSLWNEQRVDLSDLGRRGAALPTTPI